jgi:hypothetical protein
MFFEASIVTSRKTRLLLGAAALLLVVKRNVYQYLVRKILIICHLKHS